MVLTHRGRDKIPTYSNVISWKKTYEYRLLFPNGEIYNIGIHCHCPLVWRGRFSYHSQKEIFLISPCRWDHCYTKHKECGIRILLSTSSHCDSILFREAIYSLSLEESSVQQKMGSKTPYHFNLYNNRLCGARSSLFKSRGQRDEQNYSQLTLLTFCILEIQYLCPFTNMFTNIIILWYDEYNWKVCIEQATKATGLSWNLY